LLQDEAARKPDLPASSLPARSAWISCCRMASMPA
jgi:hypothetical protein